jgi:MFS family permease
VTDIRAAATATRTRPGPVPVLLVAALVVAMAQTIVVAALPGFERGLHTGATGATWLLTAFMLASAVGTPIAGRLGDLYGYRRTLVAGLLVFAAGSVLAGIADTAGSLPGVLAGRAVQGLAGGVFPLVIGIARTSVTRHRVPGVVAALSALFGVGGALGMVVAGPVTSTLGTPWLFWLPLVLAAAALAGTPLLPAGSGGGTRRALDVPGALLLAGTVVSLLLGISQGGGWGWRSGRVVGLFVLAVVLAAGFVAVELHTRSPLADLRLLRYRALATTNLATLVVSVAMFAFVALVPQYVQTPPAAGYGFGASATRTGVLLIPVAALMLVFGPLAARIAARAGARVPLQLGAALAAATFLLLAVGHDHPWQFVVLGAVLGAGYGLAFAQIGTLVVDAVPAGQTGVATGINTILRTIGGAVGAQLAAVLVTSSGGAPSETGYTRAFTAFAVIAVAALAAASTIPVRAKRRDPAPGVR